MTNTNTVETNNRLQSIDWRSWHVASDWQALVEAFFTSPTGEHVLTRLQQRLDAGAVIYPPAPLRMLALTELARVRVVILGQDPYHGVGQGEGLAFSVADGVPIPPSLRNIRKELERDLGRPPQWRGSLTSWAKQGVLLLNTVLTVEDGKPASHAGWGWEKLTQAILSACNRTSPKVVMLWGSHAQALASSFDAQTHQLLYASHPSPLSATKGKLPFIGCGHFGAANVWLAEKNQEKIDWLVNSEKNMA